MKGVRGCLLLRHLKEEMVGAEGFEPPTYSV
jgi:hypothetical protein